MIPIVKEQRDFARIGGTILDMRILEIAIEVNISLPVAASGNEMVFIGVSQVLIAVAYSIVLLLHLISSLLNLREGYPPKVS